MNLQDLVNYLDHYLDADAIPDHERAYNGLQLDSSRQVGRIALAVDACLHTIREAVARNADLLIVHHGLYWSQTTPLVGVAYRRFAPLIRADVGLYASHLPLDAHPEVGNNHGLARMLGIEVSRMWAAHEGVDIGVIGTGNGTVAEVRRSIDAALGVSSMLIGNADAPARRIGIVSGGGASCIAEAAALGLDLFITGEVPHHAYFEAEERGVNLLLAGHYATETVGVRSLGEHLGRRFGLETTFIEHPTGL